MAVLAMLKAGRPISLWAERLAMAQDWFAKPVTATYPGLLADNRALLLWKPRWRSKTVMALILGRHAT